MTELPSKESGLEKGMRYGVIALFIAFVAYVPFMIQNKEERLEKAWQEQGCKMYDMERPQDVPAKCSNTFTDHYKPQEQRVQPPEVE
jgi:hypothetical protein